MIGTSVLKDLMKAESFLASYQFLRIFNKSAGNMRFHEDFDLVPFCQIVFP